MNRYCFGIDVGGTTVKMGLFDDQEAAIRTWEIPTRKEENGRYILPDIREAMSREMIARSITPDQIVGAGIGLPGPVLADGTVNHCVNLGWGVVPVEAELSKMFYHIPVRAGNDANVAALGEAVFGGGKGYRSMVMITLGTGLGGGIIVNGKILPGSHGAGGEIGHMPVYSEAKVPCKCGKTGCLEQIASATGIVNKAKELLASGYPESVLHQENPLTARAVMDACKAGDPAARKTVDTMVHYLGKGMAMIAAVADPEVFVIGGGVSRTGQWLMDELKKSFDEFAFFGCRDTRVLPAKLGNDAGMYGAAAMILTAQR